MRFPHSQARSGLDVLLQSIDLEVAAEELVPTAPTVVWFDAVDIAVTFERRVADAILPIPLPVYAADSKTIGAITSELRAARTAPLDRAEDVSGRSVLAVLPPPVRRIGAVAIGRFPRAAARFGPATGVSSVGMFGAGWGIRCRRSR
jgi:hypothetical protein